MVFNSGRISIVLWGLAQDVKEEVRTTPSVKAFQLFSLIFSFCRCLWMVNRRTPRPWWSTAFPEQVELEAETKLVATSRLGAATVAATVGSNMSSEKFIEQSQQEIGHSSYNYKQYDTTSGLIIEIAGVPGGEFLGVGGASSSNHIPQRITLREKETVCWHSW